VMVNTTEKPRSTSDERDDDEHERDDTNDRSEDACNLLAGCDEDDGDCE
jgi:hypothetical protein